MATTIIRLYPNAEAAAAAVADLKAHSFGDDDIEIVSPTEGATVEDLTARLAGQQIPKASILALSVANGATLVAVTAIFGTAVKASVLLDRHGPIPSGINEPPAPPPVLWDPAAPFSSLTQYPILLKNAAPLSNWLKLPTLLSDKFRYLSLFGLDIPEILSGKAAPLSAALRLKVLLTDPAPLSRLFNIPVLK